MSSNTSEEGKWILDIGGHNGTLMSRDTDIRKHDSLEECRQDVEDSEKFWRSIGYFVWYVVATGPNGEVERLHEGTSYQR